MRLSIRHQIAAIFIAIMAGILFVSILVNGWFLESFYIFDKQSTLVHVYDELNQIVSGDEFLKGNTDDLVELVEVGNLSLIVITSDTKEVLTVTQTQEMREELLTRLLGYLFNRNNEVGSLLKETKNYEIRNVETVVNRGSYIEMWGYLDVGYPFLIRSPLASIQENAHLSNQFLIYITIIMAVFGCIFVLYFSKRISSPILELASISQKMADLDFETKYEGELENEIGILGENFNIMSTKLEHTISELKNANYELKKDIEQKEKIDSMRTEFIGNVSHELKTPIALIQGYAEGLKEGISEDAESREFYCDVIIDEANKMNQLVKNLLTLNQIEVGKQEVQFSRFDIVELIKGVLQSNDILIQQNHAKIKFDNSHSVFVWADEFQVEQVFRNYFSNALNHLDGERVIDITVKKDVSREKAKISVFNTGMNIPEEDIDAIWNKFYKVDKAHTREYGGNGIGLSIVKAIMDSLQQEYGVKNYENGVAFWFELDLK